jgi:hypothetical protein
MNQLETFLKIGGGLHFAILSASVLIPKALDWRTNLGTLHPFLRKLFWVYGTFIIIVIIGFGSLTLRFSGELASGAPLGRGVALFVCAFWTARLAVQLFIFDAKPFLTNWFYKLGYNALTLVFIYFAAVYGIAAFAQR